MTVEQAIIKCGELYGSDVHVTAGEPAHFRVNGDLQCAEGIVSVGEFNDFLDKFEIRTPTAVSSDESRRIGGIMCRICTFRDRNGISIAVRLLSDEVPELDDLGLPGQVGMFTGLTSGLIIITGTVGSGKSTTAAAILNEYNKKTSGVILTVEDPIEYTHKNKNCLVIQREVGKDVESFKMAMEDGLRQDLNITLIGEMRDKETIDAVLTMAETGHLVIGTAHVNSTARSVERIAGVYPPEAKDAVVQRIVNVFQGGVHMRLIKNKENQRVPFCHVLNVTNAIRAQMLQGNYQGVSDTMRSDPANYSDIESAIDLYQKHNVAVEELEKYLTADDALILRDALGLQRKLP